MTVEKGNPKLLIEYQINMLRQEFTEIEDKVFAMKTEHDMLKERYHTLAEEQKKHGALLEPTAAFLVVSRVLRNAAKGITVFAAGCATAVLIVRWLVGAVGGN